MAMPSVRIMPMNRTVLFGGVIPIMGHFSVEMVCVFMNPGIVMERMIVVIIPMKFIVHREYHVELLR